MTNCILCKEASSTDGETLIWRGDDCRVILVNDPNLPGFCRVIWADHIAEMTDLTSAERGHLMDLVFVVEAAVRHVMNPDKINVALLGNMVPHIHWHIIPRFKDDPFFPGSVWSEKTQDTPKPILDVRKAKVLELPAAIKSGIAALF